MKIIKTSFLKLILKNPFRKKSGAILSILGITIGIIVIVALGSVTSGLYVSMETGNPQEFFVMNNTVENYGTPANLNVDAVENLSNIKGIEHITPIISTSIVTSDGYCNIRGTESSDLGFAGVGLVKGKNYVADDEIIIGKLLSENENLSVGDTYTIKDTDFIVTGIFETGDSASDNSVMMNLDPARELSDVKDDEVFMEMIRVKSGYNIDTVKSEVNKTTPDDVIALTDANELDSVKNLMDIVDGATILISLLAIIIGGLGVINTMLMSVFDRVKEIGLLKAIGWSNRRVIGMILGESLVLTLCSFILGSLIAVIGVLLVSYGAAGAFTPAFPAKIFITAFIVAICVGLVGGFYPAYKASKFQPTEALRYE